MEEEEKNRKEEEARKAREAAAAAAAEAEAEAKVEAEKKRQQQQDLLRQQQSELSKQQQRSQEVKATRTVQAKKNDANGYPLKRSGSSLRQLTTVERISSEWISHIKQLSLNSRSIAYILFLLMIIDGQNTPAYGSSKWKHECSQLTSQFTWHHGRLLKPRKNFIYSNK